MLEYTLVAEEKGTTRFPVAIATTNKMPKPMLTGELNVRMYLYSHEWWDASGVTGSFHIKCLPQM